MKVAALFALAVAGAYSPAAAPAEMSPYIVLHEIPNVESSARAA